MTEIRTLNEDPSSVQAHLTIMQSVIQRMAENSRSCKVWCVTLVAATLVLVARTGEPPHAPDSLGSNPVVPVPRFLLPGAGTGVHQVSEHVRGQTP